MGLNPLLQIRLAKGQGTARAVPRLDPSVTSDLRAVPTVSAVGFEAEAGAAAARGRAAAVTQQVSSEIVDQSLAKLETLQALEAEKALSKLQLSAQAAMNHVRENTPDPRDVPQASLDAMDKLVQLQIDEGELSSFQKQYLAPKILQTKDAVQKSALTYQLTLEDEEAKFAIQEIQRSDALLVYNDPSLLEDMIAQAKDRVNTFGQSMTSLESAQATLNYTNNLVESSIRGEMNIDAGATLDKLNAGAYDVLGISAELKETLRDEAEVEVKAFNNSMSKSLVAQQKMTASALTSKVISELGGEADENGNPIKLSSTEVNAALKQNLLTASSARSIMEFKATGATRTGNPKLAAELQLKIMQSRNTPTPMSEKDLFGIMNGDVESGREGLSVSELKTLTNMVNEPGEQSLENYIQNVVKPTFLKVNAAGNIIEADPAKLQAFHDVSHQLTEAAAKERVAGRDPRNLFLQSSGSFIGADVINGALEGLNAPTPANIKRQTDITMGKTAGIPVAGRVVPTPGTTWAVRIDPVTGIKANVEFDASGKPTGKFETVQ